MRSTRVSPHMNWYDWRNTIYHRLHLQVSHRIPRPNHTKAQVAKNPRFVDEKQVIVSGWTGGQFVQALLKPAAVANSET